MTTRATFDAAQLGADLALERGDTLLTYLADTDINRCALGTDPKDSGRWRAEFFVWSPDAAESLANRVSIGIAQVGHALTTYVGGAVSVGYRLGEGQIHVGGSSVASVATGASGDVIGVVLDMTDAAAPTVTIKRNGAMLHTEALDPADGPWVLAATVAGDIDTDDPIYVLMSTGQRGLFEYDESDAPGWSAVREALGMVMIGARSGVTLSDDDPPSARVHGVLRNDIRLGLSASVRPWPMRDPGDMSLANAGGGTVRVMRTPALEALTTADVRGAQVRAVLAPEPDADGHVDLSVATPLGLLELDDVQIVDRQTLDLVLRSPLNRMNQPMLRRLARPNVDATAADRELPTSIGSVHSVEGLLLSEADSVYAMNDGPVSGIGPLRDGGFPYTDPADYTFDARGQVTLDSLAPAEYVLTADIGVQGSAYVPPAPIDALDGDGDPFSGTLGDVPTNWTSSDPAGDIEVVSGGKVKFLQDVSIVSWMQHDTATLEAGKTYLLSITVDELNGATDIEAGSRLVIGSSTSTSTYWWSVRGTSPWIDEGFAQYNAGNQANGIALPATFTAIYTPTANEDVYVGFLGNNLIDNGLQKNCVIGALTLIEQVPATYTEDNNDEPATFEQAARVLLETYGGFTADEWDAASFAAIDASTSHLGVGLHAPAGEARTLADVFRLLLDTYCADVYVAPDGRLTAWRLTPPEDETPVGTITRAIMRSEFRGRRYLAPGFTTQAACRQNQRPLVEGQMSTETLDVSLSLRRVLKAAYRIQVVTGVSVAAAFRHAIGAAPKGFAFSRRADCQREIDHVARYHSVPRWQGDVDVDFDTAYVIGSVWEFDDRDREGLGSFDPRNMHIIGVDPDQTNNLMRLTLLG